MSKIKVHKCCQFPTAGSHANGCLLEQALAENARLRSEVGAMREALNEANNRLRPKWGQNDWGNGEWVLRSEVRRPDGVTLRQDWLLSRTLVDLCDDPKRLLFDEIARVAKNVVHMAVDGPTPAAVAHMKKEGPKL